MGGSDAVWLQGEVIKSSRVLPCEPNTLPGAVTHPVSTLMAPKPQCSEEARTPQHGGTAWLWEAGDFQAAISCSLLAQLQPSSDCKMHKRSQTIQISPSFPVPQKLWDNKILAVLSTASDVLVDFFKDNSRLSRKKKNPDLYLLSPRYRYSHNGQPSATTVVTAELGGDAHSRLSQVHELAPVCRAVPRATDRPSAVPNGAPGCALKFLPQFMWSSPEPCGTRICEA